VFCFFSFSHNTVSFTGSKTIEPRIDSIAALFSKLLDDMGLTREALVSAGNNRDLHCTGDYRKLLCMPTDVDFQLLEYCDPLQPLVPTDMMRLQGIHVKLPNTTTMTAAALASETGGDSKVSSSLLAMRVGFTLPSSAYATMALRELMKRPTSAAYQGGLDLGSNRNSKNNGNRREEKNIGEQNASVKTSSSGLS
jgi:tRNA pseudouridine13 synthase